MDNNDKIHFSEDTSKETYDLSPWKIMIADDEKDVHEVTELALNRFMFDNRPLTFLHAYTANEAKELLQSNPDIAVILLDCVMETDDAGLEFVKYIREELNNKLIRIILRTGQPGHAPEREIIANYDINDYKSKAELTAQRLFTTIVTSLRSYKAEHTLLEEKEKIRITLQSITDGVISTDINGHITYMNEAAEYITGMSLYNAFNKPFDSFCTLASPATQIPIENPINTALKQRDIIELGNKVLLERADGEKRIIAVSVALTRNQQEEITGAVMTFHDQTLSENMEEMLGWQQTHDPLTNLINRREFETHIQRILQDPTTSEDNSFLLYIDINNFKIINDSCGHVAGDKLLVEITHELTQIVSETNILARIGADEFGILLTQYKDDDDALKFANSIIKRLDNYRFKWNNQDYMVTTSIGMVPVNSECEGISCVLSAANIACDAARETQRSNVNFYTEQSSDLIQKMHELTWANKLTRSIQQDEFELWCQKIEQLDTTQPDTCPHYEILVRLKDDEQLLTPDNFIPAAEKYQLMPRIDRWIINATIRKLSEWYAEGKGQKQIFCSINLSGSSLTDDLLIRTITNALKLHPFPPENICFEVTETATIAHIGVASQLIAEIKDLGCKFALDDFGSGLSSFSYLRQLPVDFLKIDGQFIKDIHHDSINYAMVNTIHHIGKIMNIQTVAEFVENDSILKKLREIGVDYGQGYAIHKPQPFDDLLREL